MCTVCLTISIPHRYGILSEDGAYLTLYFGLDRFHTLWVRLVHVQIITGEKLGRPRKHACYRQCPSENSNQLMVIGIGAKLELSMPTGGIYFVFVILIYISITKANMFKLPHSSSLFHFSISKYAENNESVLHYMKIAMSMWICDPSRSIIAM